MILRGFNPEILDTPHSMLSKRLRFDYLELEKLIPFKIMSVLAYAAASSHPEVDVTKSSRTLNKIVSSAMSIIPYFSKISNLTSSEDESIKESIRRWRALVKETEGSSAGDSSTSENSSSANN